MLKTAATAAFAGSLVFFLQGAGGPPPIGGVRHFRFTNETGAPIVELQAVVAGTGRWQGDLLDDSYLSPGQSVLLDIDDRNESCRADIKMVLDDGSQRISRGVDICRAESKAVSQR